MLAFPHYSYYHPDTKLDEMELYNDERQKLISSERALRFDAGKLARLTNLERRAEAKVLEIRAREREAVWKAEPELFPGMHFLTAKDAIERTELFDVLRRMPKGALLHGHMDAMNDARFLIDLAFAQPEMHVASPRGPLDPTAALPTWPVESQVIFKPLPSSYVAAEESIFDASYTAGEYVPVSRVREAYAGGPKAWDAEIKRLITVEPGAAYNQFITSDLIWRKFDTTFMMAESLLFFEPTFRFYLRELFLKAVDDGIGYLELRVNFLTESMANAACDGVLDHADWVRIYGEVVEEVKAELSGQGRPDAFWGATIIYSTVRFIDNDALREALEDCLRLKAQFPDLIKGFDLVGHEDSLKPLKYYLPTLLWFQDRQREVGLDVPFCFHAGETLGDGDATDDNLFDAILLGTKRIGHGFSLAKHPRLMELCRERGIALEVCPCSNEALRYTPSILNHPLLTLLANNVPVVISNDDPQVFGNFGLGFDLFQLINGSEAVGLMSLGVLTRGSIRHSLMDDEAKTKCEALWDRQWDAFLRQLVGEEPAAVPKTNGKHPNGATVNGGSSNGTTANDV